MPWLRLEEMHRCVLPDPHAAKKLAAHGSKYRCDVTGCGLVYNLKTKKGKPRWQLVLLNGTEKWLKDLPVKQRRHIESYYNWMESERPKLLTELRDCGIV